VPTSAGRWTTDGLAVRNQTAIGPESPEIPRLKGATDGLVTRNQTAIETYTAGETIHEIAKNIGYDQENAGVDLHQECY
jgi:hypothetical protein